MSVSASPIRRPFTDAYLLVYSEEHILYEIDMFFWLAQVSGLRTKIKVGSQAEATRLSNAFIESFVVHLRNLIDFLFIDAPQETDVVAADFCAAGVWKGNRPPASASLQKARTRANKEIAHLTTNRFAGACSAKQWEFLDLAYEIRTLLRVFATSAVPGRLSARVRSIIG